MKLTRKHLAVLALVANSIIWGATPPILKWSLQDIPPFTLAFLRFFVASLVVLPFVSKEIKIKFDHLPHIFLLSVVGIFIHIALFFLGLQIASSINVPIIGAAIPLLLVIGSIVYLHEKPKKKIIIGTILSLCGVVFIIIRPLFEEGIDSSILGNLFFLLSAICMVIYTLLLKKFKLPYSALTLVFWTFGLGAIMFFPLFITEVNAMHSLQHIDYRGVIGILYGAIGSSLLAYLFYNFGVEYIKGSEVGIFSYIEPSVTILVAMPLLGETITPAYIIGTLLVFAGIFIAEGHLRYHPAHHALTKQNKKAIKKT